MPGTFTSNVSATFATSGGTEYIPTIGSSVATTGVHYDRHLEHVGTSAANLNISSSITTPGLIYLCNTDSTNYVEVGQSVSSTFTPLFRLAPGDPPAIVRYDGVAFQLKANTAAVDVAVLILEA